MCRAFTRLARDDVDGCTRRTSRTAVAAGPEGAEIRRTSCPVPDGRRAASSGRSASSWRHVRPLTTRSRIHRRVGLGHAPVDFVWVADELGFAEDLVAWLARGVETTWAEATRAVLRRDFARRRRALRSDRHVSPEAARARLRGGEAAGRRRTPRRGGRAAPAGARLLPLGRRDSLHPRGARRSSTRSQRFPRSACSRSIASNSALKFPIPKPREPWRSMTSKKSVGRSWTIFVKSWSR